MRMYFDNFLTNFLCKILFQSFLVFFVKLSFLGWPHGRPGAGGRKFDSPLRNSGRCNYVSTGRVPAHDSADRLVVGDFRKGNRWPFFVHGWRGGGKRHARVLLCLLGAFPLLLPVLPASVCCICVQTGRLVLYIELNYYNVFCFEIVGAVLTWIDMIWKKENLM
jgi:hypothetical protein